MNTKSHYTKKSLGFATKQLCKLEQDILGLGVFIHKMMSSLYITIP